LLVGILTLTGCDGNCIKSHEETAMTPMVIGKGVTMVPTTDTVCDAYEKRK
jgi:hypothetical protein